MNAPLRPIEDDDAPAGFAVGDSYYQVLDPEGENYAVTGPYPDLDAAARYGITRPGSLLAVTLILHGYPARAPTAKPAK